MSDAIIIKNDDWRDGFVAWIYSQNVDTVYFFSGRQKVNYSDTVGGRGSGKPVTVSTTTQLWNVSEFLTEVETPTMPTTSPHKGALNTSSNSMRFRTILDSRKMWNTHRKRSNFDDPRDVIQTSGGVALHVTSLHDFDELSRHHVGVPSVENVGTDGVH